MYSLLFPVLALGSVLVLARVLADTRQARVTFVLVSLSWWVMLVLAFVLAGIAFQGVGWTP
jgi:hypothetical protein